MPIISFSSIMIQFVHEMDFFVRDDAIKDITLATRTNGRVLGRTADWKGGGREWGIGAINSV